MVNDEFPDYGFLSPKSIGGSAVTLNLFVPDVDKTFNQAVAAGATAANPVADMFWATGTAS